MRVVLAPDRDAVEIRGEVRRRWLRLRRGDGRLHCPAAVGRARVLTVGRYTQESVQGKMLRQGRLNGRWRVKKIHRLETVE